MSAAHRSWWQQPTWLALAASIAILLSTAVAWQLRGSRTDWHQLTAQILDDAAHGERHGSHGLAAKNLVALISQPTTKLSTPLPIDLSRLKTDGCCAGNPRCGLAIREGWRDAVTAHHGCS